MLGNPLAARRRQWRRRWWLLGRQSRKQCLDFTITFGDLLEQELVGGEVLPKREQVLGAIVAGQRRHDLRVRGMAAIVAIGGQPLGVTLPVQDAALDRKPGL